MRRWRREGQTLTISKTAPLSMIAIAYCMISGMVAIVDRKVASHQRSHEM